MGWVLSGVNAGLSAMNAAAYAANGEPVSLGVAVLCGLACIVAAIMEVS
jgi:hypothetical protein